MDNQEINQIFANLSMQYFFKKYSYLFQNHTDSLENVILANEDLKNKTINEFIVKVQWLLYCYDRQQKKIELLEAAYKVATDNQFLYFSRDKSGDKFDNFIHFFVSNETREEVLDQVLDEWVKNDRSLSETDNSDQKTTPMQMAIYNDNFNSVKKLFEKGFSPYEIAGNGFTPLHDIVARIHIGKADIALIKMWKENNLPTDAKSGENAGFFANKTPLQMSQMIGLSEIVEELSLLDMFDPIKESMEPDDLSCSGEIHSEDWVIDNDP